jgi:hypothetical protein
MALNALNQNIISTGCQTAKIVTDQVLPAINKLDVLFNGSGGLLAQINANTVVQADLDAIASYSGLTIQNVKDLMYALTATLKTDINSAFTQLEQGAARS